MSSFDGRFIRYEEFIIYTFRCRALLVFMSHTARTKDVK